MSRRLLVLRALGLGDLLTAIPALRALADAFPEHERVVAMPAGLAPLLDLSGTGFAGVDHRGLQPLASGLAGAEVAVNLHGSGPQSHRVLLDARPGRLIAFAHPGIDGHDGPEWRADEHEVDRWCRLLRESGVPADPARLDLEPPALEPPARAAGATLIHPGAASPARRWPVDRWAALARAERDAGREVVITGSADEAHAAQAVAEAAGLPGDAVLAGRTSVLELTAAVAAAGRVACGDTGVAHLATAFGTPSIVLFGPTPPDEWGPPRSRAHLHRVLWVGERGDPHGDVTDPGLLRIDAGRALAALRALPEPVAT